MIRIEHLNMPYKTMDGRTAYKATIEQADDVLNRLESLRSHPNIKTQVIPCGKCIGCRLEYSREWANRGYLESKLYKENYFITLTYNEKNLPTNYETETKDGKKYEPKYEKEIDWTRGTLKPEHLTKFMHDLRQHIKREYNATGIRFMACGEYGDKGERPHYHIILFNIHLPVETFYNPRINDGHIYYQNTIIESCWKYGISNISEASWNNIAYTARYITKKITGKQSEEIYAIKGQNKEFFRVSRMPGIGKPYYDKYKEKIYKNDEIIIKNQEGVIHCKPPKYFDALYQEENQKHWQEIKRKRQKQKKGLEKVMDEINSYTRLEQLEIKERTKKEQTQKLIRNYESKKKEKK